MPRYDYLRKYASSDTWSPSISPETVELARTAINAIQNNHDVSATMLQSVISLTYHFNSLAELLGDPSLIQDCILYLYRRKRQGVQVFDDECGYLCFRILVLATNVLIISDYDNGAIWALLVSMDGERDTHGTLFKSVELLARHHNDPDLKQASDLDSQLTYEYVISKENALTLLDLLFKDREGFLRAWSETESPTLAGLLLVLRRRIHTISAPERWVHYVDIARRNYLATIEVANDPLPKFEEDIRNHPRIWYSGAPIAVDPEDARTQLSLLTTRMRSQSNIESSAIPYSVLATSLAMHVFPKPEQGFIPGVEDLFIPLLRESFWGFWNYLEVNSTTSPVAPDSLVNHAGILIIMANRMVSHVKNATCLVSSREIMQEVVDLGLIEIVSKSILLIDDYNGEKINGKSVPDITVGNIQIFQQFIDHYHLTLR
ncbi:unnamed protein product [Rhizoctonia solani]|uniref:Uncharacterized protein n=1 Tax=Rhizoctonia solani TaxID=456999 RepID=A0A8H2WTG8_9AGAM|nr:unnamed protein product [Rhizoctonia solani]